MTAFSVEALLGQLLKTRTGGFETGFGVSLNQTFVPVLELEFGNHHELLNPQVGFLVSASQVHEGGFLADVLDAFVTSLFHDF